MKLLPTIFFEIRTCYDGNIPTFSVGQMVRIVGLPRGQHMSDRQRPSAPCSVSISHSLVVGCDGVIEVVLSGSGNVFGGHAIAYLVKVFGRDAHRYLVWADELQPLSETESFAYQSPTQGHAATQVKGNTTIVHNKDSDYGDDDVLDAAIAITGY